MAYENFRPDFGDLTSIGFNEIEPEKENFHPFDRWCEIQLNDQVKLGCDAFWDFYICIDGLDFIPIKFSDLEQIKAFIEAVRK